MNIAVYTQLHRTAVDGTGISRHAVNMVRGLSETPGMHVRVAASAKDLVAGKEIGPASGLFGIPAVPLPFSFQALERLWWLVGWPTIESWTGPIDWVYCPADAYVPTRRAKLAVTIHDVAWLEPSLPWSHTPAHRTFARRVGMKMQRLVNRASLFFVVSQFTRRRVVELLNVPEEKVVVVGNGVEDAFFIDSLDPPAKPSLAPDGAYVLMVGGLSDRKGAAQAAALAQTLLTRQSDISIIVAGMSDPSWVVRTAHLPNIKHIGYVPAQSLPALMHHSIALYFPSRYEGFGIPVIEAMAAGTPVIASAHSSLPEVVGTAGAVIPDDHPAETADLVQAFAKRTLARDSYVEAGRARALDFRWPLCVARLRDALMTH